MLFILKIYIFFTFRNLMVGHWFLEAPQMIINIFMKSQSFKIDLGGGLLNRFTGFLM